MNGQVRTIEYLENVFRHGQIPTQCDFWDLIATFGVSSDVDWSQVVPLSGYAMMSGPLSSTGLYTNCGNSDQWCGVYSTVYNNSAMWASGGYLSGDYIPLSGYATVLGPLTSQDLTINGRAVINDQLFYYSDSSVSQLSSLSGNYDEGLFIGGMEITPNNTQLINIGQNWTLTLSTLASIDAWTDSVICANGKYQAICTKWTNNYIWNSNDYGKTWHENVNSPYSQCFGLAMNSDGKYQTAAMNASAYGIWDSNDYGTTWTQNTAAPSPINYTGVAMSSDGRIRTAVSYFESPKIGRIWTSNDFGKYWTLNETPSVSANEHWGCVAMCSDGKYQTATNEKGIFTSNDYGSTWTHSSAVSSIINPWEGALSINSNGKYQLFTNRFSLVKISHDYGTTWSSPNIYYNNVLVTINAMGNCMTSNGKHQLLTGITSGGRAIYYSNDYGLNFHNVLTDGSPAGGFWFNISVNSDGKYALAISQYSPVQKIWRSVSNEYIDGNIIVNGRLSSDSIYVSCGNSMQWCSAWSIVSGGVQVQGNYVPLSGYSIISGPISTQQINVSGCVTADYITAQYVNIGNYINTQQINVSGCVTADCITGLTSIDLDGRDITNWGEVSAYYDLAGMDILPGDLLHVEYSPSAYDVVTDVPGLSAYPLSGHFAGIDSAITCISGVSALQFTNTVELSSSKTLTNYLLVMVNGSSMYLPLYT